MEKVVDGTHTRGRPRAQYAGILVVFQERDRFANAIVIFFL
jgi:hypothetical protein